MPDIKEKYLKQNSYKVEKIYFELSVILLILLTAIRFVSYFFKVDEPHFAVKFVITVVVSALILIADYAIIKKPDLSIKLKRYFLCVSMWAVMSFDILIFKTTIPFLIIFVTILSTASLFRDVFTNFFTLMLCILTTAAIYVKYVVTIDEPVFYTELFIIVTIVYEVFVYFVVSLFKNQNETALNKIVSQLNDQKKDISDLNHEIIDIQETVILSVAEIIEAKSPQTGQHVKRVSEYVKLLCTELGYPKDEVERIRIASMLHDIGKLSVPAEIIEKKGKYTPEEYEIMKTHVTEGEKILSKTPGYTMGLARIIALQHHERWDGSGYLGLKGKQIDKISRIVAVADVFDALVSSRSYKKSWPPEKVYDYIVSESGTHFDPWVVDAFIKCYDKMVETLHQFPENVFTESE